MKISLSNQVTKLHLVRPECQKALTNLNITTIEDLLYYFPRDWQDLSEIKSIAEIRPGEKVNIRAKLKTIKHHRSPWRRMHLSNGLLEDETGNIVAVWFNQPFLKTTLQAGREYYFSGKAVIYSDKKAGQVLQLQSPTFELVKEDTIHTAGIIPIYELTEGITQKQIRYFLKQGTAALAEIADFLPQTVRTELKLIDLQKAIHAIHFPDSKEDLEKARRRLAFEELFLFQTAFQSYKRKLKLLPAPQFAFNTALIKKFVESLPFKLTDSQRLAAWEILKDISKKHPMNRLLEGDVGSGKTVVAGIAMLEVARAGYQSVLLAPTEILAWQHFQTLKGLFKNTNLDIALLTRSHKTHNSPLSPLILRGEVPPLKIRGGQEGLLLENIASGRIKIIIGTHALLQEHVKFQRIGLLVVDEQHRFGVKQRGQLLSATSPLQSALIPHLLSMSATPIPRTLALAFYGDLDISRLTELPKGRKKIITKLVEPGKRDLAYDFIRKQINGGRQVYVVVPLIDDIAETFRARPVLDTGSPNLADESARYNGSLKASATLKTVTTEAEKLIDVTEAFRPPDNGRLNPPKADVTLKAVTTEAEKLRKIFPEFHIGLVHGRLKGEEKKQVMDSFKAGELNILVSTTVIEVGVDVPNATVMVIENAERFGLAQLHQLRGRVGRSDLQSYCLLFAGNLPAGEAGANEYTKKRLEAVVASNNGFDLAEKDLELRGPGEILGQRQSGYIPFKIARLSDRQMIKLAREKAEKLLDQDPKLSRNPLLRQKVESLARDIHLE